MAWWIGLSETIRNFGLLAAALIGIALGGMRVLAANRQAEASVRQAELARRTHVTDLFNRSVAQLDHDKLEVRLGAIYTLRQIAEDFPDLAGAAFELLRLYVGTRTTADEPEAPADVQEILRILTNIR